MHSLPDHPWFFKRGSGAQPANADQSNDFLNHTPRRWFLNRRDAAGSVVYFLLKESQKKITKTLGL